VFLSPPVELVRAAGAVAREEGPSSRRTSQRRLRDKYCCKLQ